MRSRREAQVRERLILWLAIKMNRTASIAVDQPMTRLDLALSDYNPS